MTVSFAVSAHLFAYEPLDFAHLEAATSAGIERIELWAMTPHFDVSDKAALGRLGGWLKRLSLDAETFHLPFYRTLEEARAGRWLSLAHPEPAHREEAVRRGEAAMEAFGALGARIAVLHPSAPSPAGEADTFEDLRASLERLLRRAEALDLRLALENIPAALGGGDAVADFVAGMAHPRLGACLDSGHLYVTEGGRFAAALRRLAPLAVATHLHDNDGKTDTHLLPGEGTLPWAVLWNALEDAGYDGLATYEIRRREGEAYAETLAALVRAAEPCPLERKA